MASRKPVKGKVHAPPGDFIALGSKGRAASVSEAEPKLFTPTLPVPVPKKIPSGTKRDASLAVGAGSSLAAKKAKIVGTPFALGRSSDAERRGSPTAQSQIPHYEEIAKDVEPHNLLNAVLEAGEVEEKVEQLLCGAVRYLKNNRVKPESSMYLTLMFLAKSRPSIFGSEVVIEAFCSLLKRDVALNYKSKGNPLVSVLACNVLMAAFAEEKHWPDNFVKVYLDDGLGERVWVDRPDCKAFVDNILTAFDTRLPKAGLGGPEPFKTEPSSACASPNPSNEDEERSLDSTETPDRPPSALSDDTDTFPVMKRYTYQQVSIEMYVLDLIREQLNRRQPMDTGSRNLVRIMTSTCGYSEMRMLAALRLEMWLQNPKLTRPAQELLTSICMNCDQHSPADLEVMSQLAKIRLKNKPLVTHYILGIRELLNQHPDNMHTMMTHTIYNELSTSRNPNNMTLITVMFQHNSEVAAKMLSEIFQELLTNRDDYLRALRTLLREIMRSVRHDMNFTAFALGLMKERNEPKFKNMEAQHKDRLLMSLADLICLTALLSVSPSVREAASAHARADVKDLEVLYSFQQQVAVIQRDATWWMHTVVPKMFEVKSADYMHCLRKLLFVETADQYCKLDNWPPESDRGVLLRLVYDIPVLEDTLMRVLIIGLTRELSLNPGDVLDLADTLVRRAAVLHGDGFEVLSIERLKLFDAIFNLCTYRYPENIVLPKGYTPPTLAISNLYWKSWVMLLLLAAFNPATIGLAAWENYPTLKCLMEMVMTNNFRFPPPTMAVDEKAAEEIITRDKQIGELEKQDILEFEGHLAAASSKVAITEANSLLLSQLTTMDPRGIARNPPDVVLKQLEGLNASLQLGAMLCRSRNPDFLLDIIHRQGASQSMPWLADLVESSEGSLDVLPVQCLCEFLLHDVPPEGFVYDEDDDKSEQQKKKQKMRKQEQLLARLQSLVHSDTSDQNAVVEVLSYFLKRLASQQTASRQLAVKGLRLVLSKSHLQGSDEDMEVEESEAARVIPTHRWLIDQLPLVPHFHAINPQICATLRQACQVETDAAAVSANIVYLSKHAMDMPLQSLNDLLLDLATLIVERPTLINHLLPTEANTSPRCEVVLTAMIDLFYGYLCKSQQPKEEYLWSNTQDQILLQWESEKSATMNVLVVHAMIILLTYGQPKGESRYMQLLDSWFPPNGSPPTAYLVDTSEEALLLPDWLKLRMIRSSSSRLVDAALQDLEPAQLVLFVQSFGLPVNSMSKLLVCLDNAVEMDSMAMERAVVDKMYMAQLVDVQHMRGALGGEHFHKMLKGDIPTPPVIESPWKSLPRRTRLTSFVSRAPELIPAQKDVTQLSTQIRTMFGEETEMADRQKAYRTILKCVYKDVGMHDKVVHALHKVLTGSDSFQIFDTMLEYPSLASPFLRLLAARQDHPTTLKLPAKLLTPPDEEELALYYKVLADLLGRLYVKPPERPVTTSRAGRRRSGQDSAGLHADMIIRQAYSPEAVEEPSARSEVEALEVMKESLRMRDVNNRVSTACHLLTPSAVQPDAPCASGAGLLVDWLEVLDPEVVAAVPDLQQRLLFAQTHHQGASEKVVRRRSNQPYLLALLTHRTSWGSLHSCIDLLLGPSAEHKRYNATAVLDFLWACLHIPKIWQGRDKKLPKNYQPENVLDLTGDQVQSVIDYILQEALSSPQQSMQSASSSSSTSQVSSVEASVDHRLPLVELCCCKQRHLVRAAISHLYKKLRMNGSDYGAAQHLLLQLYLAVPDIITPVERRETPLSASADSSNLGTSQLDALCHRLLSSLGSASHGKAAENRMDDANITCRKMATEHPLLMLRQLPMIAAILQGQAQFTFGQMKHRNHIQLYTHTLGVLDLLQPYMFAPHYAKAWGDIVQSYCELIKNHGLENRRLGSLTIKFIHLLHAYLTRDAIQAHKVLHQYTGLLTSVSAIYPDFATLKSLLAGLALPRSEKVESSTQQTNPALTAQTTDIVPKPETAWGFAQLAPFKDRIRKEAPMEDVLEVLCDLDETSKRKIDVLDHFKNDLRRLMLERNDTIRNLAHNLVMRHLRHDPSSSAEFLPTMMRCLDSADQDIVLTALRNLAEYALLAQEHGKPLLQKAFSVGVTMKADSTSYISDALQLLNLETLQ